MTKPPRSDAGGKGVGDPLLPTPGDTRYDIRLKSRVAQDCLKHAQAGRHDSALEALYRIGLGVDENGDPLPDLAERTRAQALAAYLRAVTGPASAGGDLTINHDNRRQVAVFDREGLLRALRDDTYRAQVLSAAPAPTSDDPDV